MDFKGKIKDITTSLSGEVNITLSATKEILNEYEKLKDCDLSVKICKWRNKRSLDANKYSWVLITKLADYYRLDKEVVYMDMLRKYGQTAVDEEGNAVIITLKSNVNLDAIQGIHYALINKGFINGIECCNYRLIQGQSTYDTKEMSIFIDGIVSECQDADIETISPAELQQMKERWGIEEIHKTKTV